MQDLLRLADLRCTVIDVEFYRREIQRLHQLSSMPAIPVENEKLSSIAGEPVCMERFAVTKEVIKGRDGQRLTVAAGQCLLWHWAGIDAFNVKRGPASAFYFWFGTYWTLLKHTTSVDPSAMHDLVCVERAGQQRTELLHAAVKLFERSSMGALSPQLSAGLIAWGDDLAVSRFVRLRKLAKRIYALSLSR